VGRAEIGGAEAGTSSGLRKRTRGPQSVKDTKNETGSAARLGTTNALRAVGPCPSCTRRMRRLPSSHMRPAQHPTGGAAPAHSPTTEVGAKAPLKPPHATHANDPPSRVFVPLAMARHHGSLTLAPPRYRSRPSLSSTPTSDKSPGRPLQRRRGTPKLWWPPLSEHRRANEACRLGRYGGSGSRGIAWLGATPQPPKPGSPPEAASATASWRGLGIHPGCVGGGDTLLPRRHGRRIVICGWRRPRGRQRYHIS